MDEPEPKKSIYEEIEEMYGDQGNAKPEPEAEKPVRPVAVAPISRAPRRKSGASPLLLAAAIAVGIGVGAIGGFLVEKSRLKDHETMVSVNGTPITHDEFVHRMEMASGTAEMRQMVQEQLQYQFFKQQNTLPSESDVDAAYDRASKAKDFDTKLAQARELPEDVKLGIRLQLGKANLLKRGVTVSDSEVQQYYQVNINHRNPNARYYRPNTVVVAAIISTNAADIDKAKAALVAGQTFDVVAKTYSKEAQSAARGGILDPIQEGRSPLLLKFPEIGKIVFNLNPGQAVGPVASHGTYWLIRCMQKAPEVTEPFSAVKDDARNQALLTKGVAANGKQDDAEFDDFQANAKIEVRWVQYTDAAAPKKKQP